MVHAEGCGIGRVGYKVVGDVGMVGCSLFHILGGRRVFPRIEYVFDNSIMLSIVYGEFINVH